MRVLFVATLHHPEQLQRDIAQATDAKQTPPLFPGSTSQHFWVKAMRQRGYVCDVFWRNLPGYGSQDPSRLRAQVHSERLTAGKIAGAMLRRLPSRANPDYRQRNARLIDQARRFEPDILWLVGDNTVIYPETLATIKRQTGCLLIYASGTSPIVFSHAIERAAARLYDWVLVNDYYHGVQWLELGAKQMDCTPIVAIDPDFHQPQAFTNEERAAYQADVTFVGTLVPQQLYSERVAALSALQAHNLGIWSVHDVPQVLRPFLRGYALGAQMMRVLSAATISLNVHGDFMRYGGNMRLFEAAAMGAFQLVDDRPGVPTWFTVGEHLQTYRDHDDLQQQVAYYLAPEHQAQRQAIAQAARQHALTHHTYAQRLNRLEMLLKA